MKSKIQAAVLFLAVFAAPAHPQDTGNQGAPSDEWNVQVSQIDLRAEEIKTIETILKRDQEDVVKAKAEIRALQARLSRLLLERNPRNPEIEGLVRAALDQEYIIRMSLIRNQLEIMGLLGNERWARLYKLAKTLPELERTGKAIPANSGGNAGERNRLLVKILRQLP
jgi:hypothetical protein